MNEERRKQRNSERLLELYPTFRKSIRRVLVELELQGLRPRIQDAWRSPEDQLKAFQNGHSKLKFGFHNVTGQNGGKEALAVDMLDDNFPLNPRKPYLLRLAAAAEKHGLITGIRWGLSSQFRGAIDQAILDQDWRATVKIGWDPTHIQPTNISVGEAKQGLRPT